MIDQQEKPQSASSASLETILVVEDEVLVRMVISEHLRECGYRVIEAASADEALIVLNQTDLDLQVVFSDVQMPGTLDGFGLARWIRSNRPDLRVVLAGTVGKAAEAAADLCEAGPMLAKPYAPAAVVDQIKRLSSSKRNWSADSAAAALW